MSVLVGGISGASSRLGGGLAAVNPMSISDVTPARAQTTLPSLGQRAGKFRRIIRDVTKDASGGALPGATVKVFCTGNDLKFDQIVSDAAGVFEASVYDDSTYYAVAYKAGAPDVAGTTVNTLRGV